MQKAPLKPPSRVKTKTSARVVRRRVGSQVRHRAPGDPWAQPPDDLPDERRRRGDRRATALLLERETREEGVVRVQGAHLGRAEGGRRVRRVRVLALREGGREADRRRLRRGGQLERQRREEHVKAMKKVNPNPGPVPADVSAAEGEGGGEKGTTLGGRKGDEGVRGIRLRDGGTRAEGGARPIRERVGSPGRTRGPSTSPRSSWPTRRSSGEAERREEEGRGSWS